MAATVTSNDLQNVIGVLVGQAKAGEPWAVKELLNRCLGRPTQAVAIESGLTWQQMIVALETAQTSTEGDDDEKDGT